MLLRCWETAECFLNIWPVKPMREIRSFCTGLSNNVLFERLKWCIFIDWEIRARAVSLGQSVKCSICLHFVFFGDCVEKVDYVGWSRNLNGKEVFKNFMYLHIFDIDKDENSIFITGCLYFLLCLGSEL